MGGKQSSSKAKQKQAENDTRLTTEIKRYIENLESKRDAQFNKILAMHTQNNTIVNIPQTAHSTQTTHMSQAAEVGQCSLPNHLSRQPNIIDVPTEATKTPHTVTSSYVVTFPQAANTRQAINPPQAVYNQQAIKTPQSVNTQQMIKPAQSVNTQQVITPAQSVNTQQVIKPAQAVTTQQAIKPAQSVNTQQAIKPVQSVNTQQAIKPAQSVNTQQVIKPAQAVTTQQAIKPLKAVNTPQTIKLTLSVNTQQAIKPAQSVNTQQVIKPAQSVNTQQAIKPAQSVNTQQAIKPAQSVNTQQAIKPAQDVNTQNAVYNPPAGKSQHTINSSQVVHTSQIPKISEAEYTMETTRNPHSTPKLPPVAPQACSSRIRLNNGFASASDNPAELPGLDRHRYQQDCRQECTTTISNLYPNLNNFISISLSPQSNYNKKLKGSMYVNSKYNKREFTRTQPSAPLQPRRDRSVSRHRSNNRTEDDELNCPTCLSLYGLQIYQCNSGHSSCKTCKDYGRQCGICGNDITTMRNITLEGYVAERRVPCPHRNDGCMLVIKMADMEFHVKECPFKELRCPLGCFWMGKLKQLSAHFDEMHREQRAADVDREMRLQSITKNSQNVFLILIGAFNFLFHVKVSEVNSKIFMAAQLIGTKVSASKWSYEIHVYNKNESRRKYTYTDTCTSYSEPVNEIFDSGNCSVLPTAYATTFANNGDLTFKIFIKKPFESKPRKGRNNN